VDRFRKILFCLVLGLGSITGVAMRPEEIEELMHAMNQPRVEVVVRQDADPGEPPTVPPASSS
jgi:hypothetical protein